jgi:hypothetical protein
LPKKGDKLGNVRDLYFLSFRAKNSIKNHKLDLVAPRCSNLLFPPTRKNRAFCKEKGIRISGVPLGRPPKNISEKTKKQAQEDERIRNAIEGKFGQGKRRFSLNKIMTKLPSGSATTIAIIFLVMNLSALLREFLYLFFIKNLLESFVINRNYILSIN